MTKEDLKEKCIDIIKVNQSNYDTSDNKVELVYTLAFNDGVTALYNALMKKLEEEENATKNARSL